MLTSMRMGTGRANERSRGKEHKTNQHSPITRSALDLYRNVTFVRGGHWQSVWLRWQKWISVNELTAHIQVLVQHAPHMWWIYVIAAEWCKWGSLNILNICTSFKFKLNYTCKYDIHYNWKLRSGEVSSRTMYNNNMKVYKQGSSENALH